jgi:hypothetical protein
MNQVELIGMTLFSMSLMLGGLGWLAWALTDQPDLDSPKKYGAQVAAERLHDLREIRKMLGLAPVGLLIFLVGLLIG